MTGETSQQIQQNSANYNIKISLNKTKTINSIQRSFESKIGYRMQNNWTCNEIQILRNRNQQQRQIIWRAYKSSKHCQQGIRMLKHRHVEQQKLSKKQKQEFVTSSEAHIGAWLRKLGWITKTKQINETREMKVLWNIA